MTAGKAITDKRAMYAMLARGDFGHTLPSAETMEDALALVSGGVWAVRSKQAGGPCAYGLTADAAMAMAAGLPAGTWNVSPMLSDEHRRCYAHLYDSPAGLRLHYTEARKASRLVYAEDGCEQKWLDGGLAVRAYVRSVCDQQGQDTIEGLLHDYPGHVIEFTAMSSRMHAFGPSNTIIFEVRPDGGHYEAGVWGGRREVDWDAVDAELAACREAWRRVEERRAAEPKPHWEDIYR